MDRRKAPWLGVLLETAATALIWALLSRAAALFEVRPGLSFFFPAAAVTVGAAVRLRWLSVAAMVAGNFIFPWGASVGFLRMAAFALPAATWAAIMVALPAPRGDTWSRLRRFALFGVIGGSLASGLLGAALLVAFVGPASVGSFMEVAGSWWIGDLAAALAFGLPLVVVLRAEVIMAEEDERMWRDWWLSGREPAVVAILALGSGVVAASLTEIAGASIHWFVALLLPALAVAGMRGGLGAGLLTNGLLLATYLSIVLVIDLPRSELAPSLAATYGNVALFSAFSVMSGIMGGRQRRLVDKVRQQGDELAHGLERTVETLAVAMEAKDSATESHVRRVVRFACQVGHEMGLSDEEIDTLRRAAILHDVGRIGVPDAVFDKPGLLSAAEQQLVRERQVGLGVAILEKVELLQPVVNLVRYQRERWDGDRSAKYPSHFGLKGEATPLGSRILAVVEAYDAMTHDRPHRKAMAFQAAVAELWRCSGSQFDPEVVSVFIRILREEWTAIGG